ncbi:MULTISPECIES: HD domain-containing protein [Brucella]|uniref:HD domain-containing protein n=2 Tax=Brucella pseudogrignonensis TaxID=419475 RepID=A0A7Y3T558_9HYPH|nr:MULTISPECIES: HD domain-containing protein [Brucella]EMG55492.1 metal dependent phosphohydrolase [Ochrobactrum sp. CDB2]MCD4510745.1 HD domain-containing protein [Brucella pseudogrignonensis]NNV21195.1 HD domain-containing protein [Brucella pseudogrignonensis]
MTDTLPLKPLDLPESEFASLVPNARLRQQFQFILEVEKLKQVIRRTPLLDTSRRENDAEHTWELVLMAMVLQEHANENVDLLSVLKMLIIHDIVEIDAGDTFIYDDAGALDQEEREMQAATRIFGILPEDQALEFRALWDEFEARKTAEAQFARAMDRLQPLLHNFFTSGGTWHTPGVTAPVVLDRKSPISHASDTLWEAAQRIIAEGVERGFLKQS